MAPHRYRFELPHDPPGMNLTGVWMVDAAPSPALRYALVQHPNGTLTIYAARTGDSFVSITQGRYSAETDMMIAELTGYLLDERCFVLRTAPSVSTRFRRSPGGSAAVCFVLAEFLTISPDPEVRHHISLTLGHIPHPAVVDALLPVLEHPDAGVRFNAIEALWNHVDDRLVAPMVTLVRCFIAGERSQAAFAGTSQILFHLAHATGAQATSILIQVVQAADLSDDLRVTAANSLMQQNRRYGVPIVVEALPLLSEPLQERIARLLFDLNDSILLDYLPPYLTAPNVYLKLHAAGILSHLGHPTALDVLLQSLQTTEYPHSATYLARLSDPRIIPALIQRIPTAPPPLRATIFHTLGPFRDERTIPIFEAGLHDPDPTVKRAAASGLGHIQAHVQRSEPARGEPDASVSTDAYDAAALQAFATIKDSLTQLATSPAWAIAAAASETLRLYVKAHSDPNR
jgi:HEAT repeat protein